MITTRNISTNTSFKHYKPKARCNKNLAVLYVMILKYIDKIYIYLNRFLKSKFRQKINSVFCSER